MEQRSIRLDAHNVRYRHSDAEGTENPLYHNKSCSANSIIESGVSEEDSSEQTVNGIGFQVICGCCYYFRVGGENTCQDISMEEGNCEHYNTDGKGNCDAIVQCLSCSGKASGTIILCYESRHGLHKSG